MIPMFFAQEIRRMEMSSTGIRKNAIEQVGREEKVWNQ